MNALTNTNLQFLKIEKYRHMYTDTTDFTNIPRPFFNVAMILDGKGNFYTKSETVTYVVPGDIIIIPTASTYMSEWSGTPEISYITLHFIIENVFDGDIPIQKICGLEHLKNDFELAYNSFSSPDKKFKALGIFFSILHEIYPKITTASKKQISVPVKEAITYITFNYTKSIIISKLAKIASLSPSRFFSVFKKETGMTPIEYKNSILVQNAKKMLLTTNLSVEEISEKLGFNSTSYFRRLFKSFEYKSPREYRKCVKASSKL